MSITELLTEGYKEFPVDKRFKPYAAKGFQKRFDDEKGKKFFITVYFYAPIGHVGPGFTAEEQMNLGGKHFNVELINASSLCVQEMEAFFANMWERLECDHYETWEES